MNTVSAGKTNNSSDIPVINPFLSAAKVLDAMVKAPPLPMWSRVLTRLCLGVYVIMFLQAVFLLYQRIRIKEFFPLKFNKLGFVVINIGDASAFFYITFAPLAIVFLSLQLAVEHGISTESASSIIFGYMFLVIHSCSGTYLWACICQCSVLLWESDFVMNLSKETRGRLQFVLKWGINLGFPLALSLPFPPILWAYGTSYRHLHKIFSMVHQTHAALMLAAKTYDPKTYHYLELSKLFIPVLELKPILLRTEHTIMFGMKCYTVAATLTGVVYIPLLVCCFRSFYRQSVSQKALDVASGYRGTPQKSNRGPTIYQQRRQMIFHGLAVYAANAVFLPFLYWQVYDSPPHLLLDAHWREVTSHGFTIPFSLAGNIVLLILNTHSTRVLRKKLQIQRRETGKNLNSALPNYISRASDFPISPVIMDLISDDEAKSGDVNSSIYQSSLSSHKEN